MSKLLSASCENNEVTIEGQKVTPVTILSQGKAASQGAAVVDDEKVVYIASNATDLAQTIQKACEMIQDIALMFTSIASGMTGPTTAPPGTIVADVASLNAKATELLALKDNLK